MYTLKHRDSFGKSENLKKIKLEILVFDKTLSKVFHEAVLVTLWISKLD